uniref:hypothetical protein n=1 Tax=Ornithobacterium rhinotracheale TaxID=28251 RepID=UPI0039A74186
MFDNLIKKIEFYLAKIKIFNSDVINENLTNQELINQIADNFESVMNRESFDSHLIYDCSFLIMMRPEDYYRIEMRLPLIVEGLVNRFYKIIARKKSNYSEYKPLGNYWHFHFCPQEQGIENKEIPYGKVEIISTPTSIKQDWGETLDSDLISSSLISVSVNGKHSKYSKFDLNFNNISNVDILEKGRMRVRFNENLIFDKSDLNKKDDIENQTLAKLSYELKGKKWEYKMISNQIEVAQSKNENEKSTNKRLSIYCPNNGLEDKHFILKYERSSNQFKIALLAPARVNGEKLMVNSDMNNLDWTTLKQQSKILCGLIQFNFEALK